MLIKTNNGGDEAKDWLLYHSYLRNNPGLKRTLCMDKIVWTDGWPEVAGLEPSSGAKAPVFKNL
jgi:arabinan endo-1,5-alpha-L-arabinosidase